MRNVIALVTVLYATVFAFAGDAANRIAFTEIQLVLNEFCFECHSTEAQEGELDLQRFTSVELVRRDTEPWQAMIQQLETREMPPKDHPQPSDVQRQQLIDWTKQLLDSESLARAGDPGYVPLHRLSNTEYDFTIRDLTGIDLRPARDFPADGAAGEGFTNAAEALSMSPAMMAKYVNAAKNIAAHAVLLPDGFRFSQSATKRDWTDESLEALRAFYRPFTYEGSLPLKPYIEALVERRDDLHSETVTIAEIAANKNLSTKYLGILWRELNGSDVSYPLDRVRSRWMSATPNDVDAVVTEASSWFDRLWEFPRIGSYVNTHRQKAKDPAFAESHSITINMRPEPGQNEVVLYLVARELITRHESGRPMSVIWDNPRFEGANLPTLWLRDYREFGSRYEVDFAKLFSGTGAYLAAAIELANADGTSLSDVAAKHNVHESWLKRWVTVLDVKPRGEAMARIELGREVPNVAWRLLDELAPNSDHPAINGWRPKGTDLPILISNASDQAEDIPGHISSRSVAMHPMPNEFVAVVWTSPIAGRVRVSGNVTHAHPSCGNGVAWWVEKRSSVRSAIVAEGVVDLGKETSVAIPELQVSVGDSICLAIDARDASHVCDLTEVDLVISEITVDSEDRVWDLAEDVANDVTAGNPHSDRQGNPGVWSFVTGASADRSIDTASAASASSILARWRIAAADSGRESEADQLAEQLQTLLSGNRPAENDQPNRSLFDQFVSVDGPLLRDFDWLPLVGGSESDSRFGIDGETFGRHPSGQSVEANALALLTDNVTEIRLPAALFRDRKFVVEAKLDADSEDRAVQFQVLTTPPAADDEWDASAPIVVAPGGSGRERFLAGLSRFRDLFPPNVCYPHIIPLDEVVCLKTFHREDEPLIRLFLNDAQAKELERLWIEHRFITRYPIVENEYLPLFIGFVTQDQPKESLQYFEDKRPEFQRWADDFEREFEAAARPQMEQLMGFASRAYRRPLAAGEREGLASLYETLRSKDVPHEEAFRSVLARILMSPSFLLHLESSPPTTQPQPVNEWELASRLSYFLWSSIPDNELRQLADEGRLHEPQVLADQTRRMLRDDRVRALAIEFGTQWIHVRGFDEHDEKNEELFPEFDQNLRSAMYGEAILFFQDLFQNNGNAASIIDADYTFLNEALAKHYGIEGVRGDDWRRVDGVKQFGRGGVLGFASVLTKQAGSSRTSPILRGNWIVETLLGEKLPLPPPNIPQLPESEIGNGGLTMREIVLKHVSAPECASCHVRIDPFGLALEHYDPIGRRRETDLGGLPVDASAKLRNGTEFVGIDGLRDYLVALQKETIVRLFYRRLVGYSIGRSTLISDQVLIDQMMNATDDGELNITKAVVAIVQSPQFRMIRGSQSSDVESVSSATQK